jgi:hypothetical protein
MSRVGGGRLLMTTNWRRAMVEGIRIYITTNMDALPASLKDCVVAFIKVTRREAYPSDGYHYSVSINASGSPLYSGVGDYISGGEEVFDHKIFEEAIMLKDFGDDEVTSILGGVISKDDILRVAYEDGIELSTADIDCIMGDMDCDHYASMREYISGVIDEYLN